MLCRKVFQTKQYLQRHQKTVHVQQGISCDQCEKTFSKNSDLKRHKNTVHEKKQNYSCKICAKQFSRSDQSSAHYKKCKAKHDRIHEMSLKEERNEIKDFFEDPASSYQSGFEIFLSENVNIEEYQCDQCFKIKEEMHTDKTNFKKRNRFRRRL